MAKRKSKTQKYKKNQKRKIQKTQINISKQENNKKNGNIPIKEKQLVPKEKVKYNVVLTEPKNQKRTSNNNNSQPQKNFISKIKEKISNLKKNSIQKSQNKSQNTKVQQIQKKKVNHKIEKEIKKAIPKTKDQDIKKKNIFLRLLYEIKVNSHIIFNTIIIITFIFLLIGLFRINVLKTGTIIYISCIILFLMIVAISYNKYMSGKIFTLIITAGMIVGIYYMQYTYDFIRNLNSNIYEYKTYYVVAFDTTINRSIYTINNKKVGLLKENCINVERKLNTKLNKINYIEYEDINNLFQDFYNSKFKAILVNENQYKYLKNNIEKNSRDIKILYEFKANAKK